MSRRIKTIDDYRQLADELGYEYILDDIPRTVADKVKGWKCREEGHIREATYKALLAGQSRCNICSGNRPKTLEDYKKLAKERQYEYIFDYIPKSVITPISGWRRLDNNEIEEISYSNLAGRKLNPKKVMKTIKDYQTLAQELGYTYMEDNIPKNTEVDIPKNTEVDVEWYCIENGHVRIYSFAHLFHHRTKCVECSNRKRKTIDDYKQLARLMDGEYTNTEIPANTNTSTPGWTCSIGHTWPAAYNNISSRQSWCPHCKGIGRRNLEHYQYAARVHGLEYILERIPSKKSEIIAGWKCNKHQIILEMSMDQINSVDIPCNACIREQAESKNNIQTKEEKQNDDGYELIAKLPGGKEIQWILSADGYINCTKICQSFDKRIDKWNDLESSKALLKAYESITSNRVSEFKRVIKGGNNLNIQGTYYPPDIAIQILQWCDPYFALYVSRIIREMLLTGKVQMGKEMDIKELDKLWSEKVEKLKKQCEQYKLERDEYETKMMNTQTELITVKTDLVDIKNKLQITEIKLEKTKQKQQYPNLEKGYLLYSVHNPGEPEGTYKIGISKDINATLAQYRRLVPKIVIDSLIYLPEDFYNVIETHIKLTFRKYRESNHEVYRNIILDDVLSSVETYCKMLDIPFSYAEQDVIDRYNTYILTE